MILKIITALSAFFQLVNNLWDLYRREKVKAEVAQEVKVEHEKIKEATKADAKATTERVSRMSDDDLDQRLRKYYRD